MQGCKTLTTMMPPATVAIILNTSNPDPPAIVEPASAASEAIHSGPPAFPDDSVKFRADIRRRYETPFETSWLHGGLND